MVGPQYCGRLSEPGRAVLKETETQRIRKGPALGIEAVSFGRSPKIKPKARPAYGEVGR